MSANVLTLNSTWMKPVKHAQLKHLCTLSRGVTVRIQEEQKQIVA